MLLTLILSTVLATVVFPHQESRMEDWEQDPNQLVSEVIANEINAAENDHSVWCFKQVQHQGQKVEEREYVETPSGSIYRVLARNGRPLNPEEAAKEDARIQRLIEHPEELQKLTRQEKKDTQQAQDLLKMLPQAFQFRYAGRRNNLIKLDFTPRPSFRPEKRTGQVFRHMVGSFYVDASQKRLAEIEGCLVSEVKFGGGILGYLEKGGTFVVNQSDIGDGIWQMTRLNVNMSGKALFFKTIDVRENQQDSDFKPLQRNMTLRQAAEILRKSASPQARTSPSSSPR